MNKSNLACATDDRGTLSSDLAYLVERWKEIQGELDRIALLEATSMEIASSHRGAINEMEELLVSQERQILESVRNFKSQSLADIQAKLMLWKQLVAPQGANVSAMSLPEQIAISALRDLGQ